MSELISVLYISRATFEPLPSTKGIEPHVGRILQSSRSNNAERSIGGVLFYGDGYFFQCLEGDKDAVHELMATIRQDERHEAVKIISERPIQQRFFGDWSMKYTSINRAVKNFLKEQGFSSFNPYKFTAEQFKELIQTLRTVSDMHTGDQPTGDSTALANPKATRNEQPGNRKTDRKKSGSDNLPKALLIMTVIIGFGALAIALV